MIKSWSYTKLEHYESCPRKFLLEDVQRVCGKCFKGTVPWGDGEKCDKCGAVAELPEAIARGIVMHKELEAIVLGRQKVTLPYVGVKREITRIKSYVKAGQARVEIPFILSDKWTPMGQYAKGRWFTGKGDVVLVPGHDIEVIDWKSGGVDREKKIRVGPKYDDQCELYSICALIVFPAAEKAKSKLVFTDAVAEANEQKGPTVERKDLPKLQKKWEKKVIPMFRDTVHAPLPSFKCNWCPYRKGNGGPCPY